MSDSSYSLGVKRTVFWFYCCHVHWWGRKKELLLLIHDLIASEITKKT